MTFKVEDDVRRFHISMDDIMIVGILQSLGEFGDQFSRFARIERPVVQLRF